ncbi:MAG TPA: hypothetical protein VIL50_01940 [Candidatus Limnocylindrales bacterium]
MGATTAKCVSLDVVAAALAIEPRGTIDVKRNGSLEVFLVRPATIPG